VEFKDRQSIYLQIADRICDGILLGKWQPGERIPSVRELAVTMEVNPHTILRSYESLQNRNIIFNKRGLGYSVAASGKEQIIAYRKERFIEQELPLFLSTLVLLNIGMDEVKAHYDTLVSKNNSVEHNS
jgi:GntR family transcriptional regulator